MPSEDGYFIIGGGTPLLGGEATSVAESRCSTSLRRVKLFHCYLTVLPVEDLLLAKARRLKSGSKRAAKIG